MAPAPVWEHSPAQAAEALGISPSGKSFTSLYQPQHQTKSSFLVNRTTVLYSSPLTGSSGPCAVTHFLQQADDEMSKEKLFSCLVYACKKTLQATPNLRTPQCSARLFPWYLPGVISSALSSPFPLTHWPPRSKIQCFPNNSKAFPQFLRSQLGGKPQGCFCEDRTPTVSRTIIRHLSKLQGIRSREKSVREFYMHCFVQKKIMKGRAKTIYQS